MDDPVAVQIGGKVSASTLASKRAKDNARDRGAQPAASGLAERPVPAIQYTPEVLENIRMLCVASFVTDGAGVPIIGLLYGTRTEDEIRVTAWAPAGELRNHNDAEFALKLQMRMAPGRPETAGLECLGWVRTRNHGEPRMVDEDRSLMDRCFPAAWQTTMVVRPSYQKPTKAAFYLRAVDHSIRFDRPAQEFFLYPAHEGEIEVPRPGAIEPRPSATERGEAYGNLSQLASQVSVSEPHPELSRPELRSEAMRSEALRSEPLRSEQLHAELLPRGTVRSFSPWIAAMLVLVGLLAGSGIAALRGKSDAPGVVAAAGEPLRVLRDSGGWQVRWDRALAELKGASGAELSVTRDGRTKTIALPLSQLQQGFVHLDWVSDDMEVALRVDRPGYPEVEQFVRVVGMSRPQAVSKPRRLASAKASL